MIEPDYFDEKLAGGGSDPTLCWAADFEPRSRAMKAPMTAGGMLAIKNIGAPATIMLYTTIPGASS